MYRSELFRRHSDGVRFAEFVQTRLNESLAIRKQTFEIFWKMFAVFWTICTRNTFLEPYFDILYLFSKGRYDKKNLWRRKCVRRAILRNVEVGVEGGNPYFVCNTSNCVTVRPVRGHLTPKMNIAFFIRYLTLNIFLFDNFFEQSCIFREKRKKLFWGRIWQFFREKGLSRRKLT